MRVFKRGNDLALRIPKPVVRALGLKAGDEIDVRVVGKRAVEIARPMTPEQTLELVQRIRSMAVPLPANWKFDRDEANSR